ncbi:MAG: hypothetical protein K0Q66_1277, partial [Chitinophagaceae bacterium]|nr:hypothetical protein [Chitinophagaceae bacterium]
MKNILLLAIVTLGLHSCHVNMGKKVRGNGKLTTIERDVADASRIKVLGSMNIVLASGPTGLKVEADENLVPYIITEIQDGWLVIKTRDNVNFRTKNPINVYVSTDILHAIHLSGSGNVTGTGKFKDPKNLAIQLTGSGDVRLDVNSPEVAVNLRG